MSALKRFAILLYDSYEPQTPKIAVYSDAQGFAIKKRQLYGERNVFGPKNVEKMGFHGVFRSAQKQFGVLL